MTLIECCLSNISAEGLTTLQESEHDARETICLDRCGTCYAEPFLVADGELRTGSSHRALLQTLDAADEVGES